MENQKRYYLVRAHKQGDAEYNEFFSKSVVAVGWSHVDFTQFKTGQEVAHEVFNGYYKDSDTNQTTITKSRNQIKRFKEMPIGSVVVVPRGKNLCFATVLGKEIYAQNVRDTLDLSNQRAVKYLKSADGKIKFVPKSISENKKFLNKIAGSRMACNELTEFADEIEMLMKYESTLDEIEKYIPDDAYSEDESSVNKLGSIGTNMTINRESPEKALNVKKYAKILANFFENTEGDLNFGLFGSWGRGKTFLMKEVKNALKDKNYNFVEFDAWKYKNQPQVWAHLYNSVYNSFLNKKYEEPKNFWGKVNCTNKIKDGLNHLKIVTRFNLHSNKYWPLLFGLLLLNFTLMFPDAITQISILRKYKSSPITLNVISYLVSLFLVIKNFTSFSKLRLKEYVKYLKLPNHNSNLGLQDVIGGDLKKLFLSTVKVPDSIYRKYGVVLLSVSSLILLTTLHLNIPLGWLVVTLFVTICFIVLFSIYLLKPNKCTSMLVVDNLDRCTSYDMLNVIESIRLLLDDDGLKDILQTVMLIDDKKLRFAIADKYSDHIGIDYKCNGEDLNYNPEPEYLNLDHKIIARNHLIVDEQINKLFISYLKLTTLSKEDSLEINRKYFNEFAKKDDNYNTLQRIVNIVNSEKLFEFYFENEIHNIVNVFIELENVELKEIQNNEVYKIGSIFNSNNEYDFLNIIDSLKIKTNETEEEKNNRITNGKKVKSSSSNGTPDEDDGDEEEIEIDVEETEEVDTYFSIDEEELIANAIKSMSEKTATEVEMLNPRFIRSFMFKYLLARNILSEVYHTSKSEKLPDLIMEKIIENSQSKDPEKENDKIEKTVIDTVVDQVVC